MAKQWQDIPLDIALERSVRCSDRIEVAALFAALGAVFKLTLVGLTHEQGGWAAEQPIILSGIIGLVLAYAVSRRQKWPALAVAVNWWAGLALSLWQGFNPIWLLVEIVVGTILVRGAVAAFEYSAIARAFPGATEPAG